jgi:hypothetical protein
VSSSNCRECWSTCPPCSVHNCRLLSTKFSTLLSVNRRIRLYFRLPRDVGEICALLGCYAASTLKIDLISCPEPSARIYHYALRNKSEELRSQTSPAQSVWFVLKIRQRAFKLFEVYRTFLPICTVSTVVKAMGMYCGTVLACNSMALIQSFI